MKKAYNTPAFVVEQYTFNDSIAACQMHYGDPDTNEKIWVNKGDAMCPVGDSGHHAGGNNGNKGSFAEYPVSIFGGQCDFDWNGSTGSFQQAFYGNSASPDQHGPAIQGKSFWS